MTRGDLVTVAARGHYSGKPRPALIIQSDFFGDLSSIAICLISTESVDAPLIRVPVEPTATNGLENASQVMVDKIVTVPRSALGQQIGTLEADTLLQVDRSLALFLGIGVS